MSTYSRTPHGEFNITPSAFDKLSADIREYIRKRDADLPPPRKPSPYTQDVVDALVGLGATKKRAIRAVEQVIDDYPEDVKFNTLFNAALHTMR
jgi:Holliday junction resolvasome RuvABC DNA-binding subunit